MSRLTLEKGSFQDIMINFSEGNPGAMTVLMELNPGNPAEWFPNIMIIDNMELYGSKLYMLWNDSCNRDIIKVKKILQLFKEDKITNQDIDERIKNVGWGKPFDDLLEKYKDAEGGEY